MVSRRALLRFTQNAPVSAFDRRALRSYYNRQQLTYFTRKEGVALSYSPIAGSEILSFSGNISALDDQPNLSAADLKAYFDKNPQHLRSAHNILVHALLDPGAAAQLGFEATAGVTGDTIQQAIENVQQQLGEVALSTVPDASVTAAKLSTDIQQTLTQSAANTSSIATLQQQAQTIRPSGAQFPLMVLALTDGCPAEITDDIATAALGGHFASEVYDLGIQLAWLCRWKNASLPSDTFRAKQTINAIFNDVVTLTEIESLPPVRSLISLSAEMSGAYHAAMDNAGL